MKVHHTIECDVPISVNDAYRNVPKVGRVKTGAYKAWAKRVEAALGEVGKAIYKDRKVRWKLFLLLGVGDNRDVSNCIKVAEDVLSTHFGLLDALNDTAYAERIDAAVWPGWRGRACIVIEVEVPDDQPGAGVRQVEGPTFTRVPAVPDQQGRRRRKPHRDGGDPAADHVGVGQP